MKSRNQSYIIYLLLFIAIVAMVYFNIQKQPNAQGPLTISQVAQQVEAGKITRIVVKNDNSLTVISVQRQHNRANGAQRTRNHPRLAIAGPGCNTRTTCKSLRRSQSTQSLGWLIDPGFLHPAGDPVWRFVLVHLPPGAGQQ